MEREGWFKEMDEFMDKKRKEELKNRDFTDDQKNRMEKAVKDLIEAFGYQVDGNAGLEETPRRAMKYWTELLQGSLYTNDEIAEMFDKCFEISGEGDLVLEKDIEIFSHCEHHLALMYDMKVAIAYIPNGKVIGLSKMARIAEMCAKRLQLQERIGEDICEVMMKVLGTEDVAVIIEGKHGCMTARGAKSRGAVTRTAALKGKFRDLPTLRSELYSLLK